MSDILLRPIIAMQVAVHQLREREDGQTTTEYAILLGFLAIAIIIALFFLRNVLRSLFSTAASPFRGLRTRQQSGRLGHGRPQHRARNPVHRPGSRRRCSQAHGHDLRTSRQLISHDLSGALPRPG